MKQTKRREKKKTSKKRVKCIEGMQMNWASYPINELKKDFREA
jgi:hypothetical protein